MSQGSRSLALAVCLGAALLALTAGDARADRATEIRARKAFAAGQYDQAIDLFAQLDSGRAFMSHTAETVAFSPSGALIAGAGILVYCRD
jgi:hypothetical protein